MSWAEEIYSCISCVIIDKILIMVIDRLTYKIQKTVMELLDKFPKLSKSEQETLNLLMDKNARENLIKAISDADSGKGVSGAAIFNK